MNWLVTFVVGEMALVSKDQAPIPRAFHIMMMKSETD